MTEPASPAAPAGALALPLAGETLWLLPQRALCWPARRTLVVADLHFGKDDVFRRAGLALPEGAVAEDLARLDALLAATRSERLLVLGDFLHGDLQPGDAFPPRFARWRAIHRELAITVVAGNHDRHARRDGAAAAALEVAWQAGALHDGPFAFVHDPDLPHGDADATAAPAGTSPRVATVAHAARFRLGGHLHPVTLLPARGGPRLRVPVFWQRRDSLVLPAFGRLTGGHAVRPAPGEQLMVASPERVIRLRAGLPTSTD
jgi:metallophosphoesterase superfamily enzyme